MIPFVDLPSQYQQIKDQINPAVQAVMAQGNFILGQPVKEFEQAFAQYCQSRFSVGVASGTDALALALRALDIGPGDEVITQANTFVATTMTISHAGAKPVLVDCDPVSYNLDVRRIEEKITPKTKAIMPVHLYGQMADMDAILALAKKHGLKVIEDACQAHGAKYKGKRAGSLGDVAGFSFYPGKNLGAYGDGGGIVTNSQELYDRLLLLRNHGSPQKYHHDVMGFNSRLDTIQAVVLQIKLQYLDQWNANRVKAAKLYHQKLQGVGDLALPDLGAEAAHIFHLFVVRSKQREALMAHLNSQGVQNGIHYPIPIYRLGAYQNQGYKVEDYPVTEAYSKEIFSLPMFPEITEAQIDQVVQAIRSFFG